MVTRNVFPSAPCPSEHPLVVILSKAKNLLQEPECNSRSFTPPDDFVQDDRRPSETASFDKEPVRRGVAGLTPLRTDDAIQSIY